MNISALENRCQIPLLLNEMGLTGMGVEIGVQSGWYSNVLLANSGLKRLFSVDPWNKPEGSAALNISEPELYLHTVRLLARYGTRSVVLRMYSAEAAQLFQPGSLDFAYIDADHWYPCIYDDIRLWYPLVKPGGILAGHDYHGLHSDVKRAVDEFAAEKGLTVHSTVSDQIWSGQNITSWLIQVPTPSQTATP